MKNTGLSREEAQHVLSLVPGTLRKQASLIKDLQEKLASYEKRGRAVAVVSEMETRGLVDPSERSEKTAELAALDESDLRAMERVVPMAAPSVVMGKVAEDMGDVGPVSEKAAAVRSYLLER